MPQPKLAARAPIERVSDLIQDAEPYHRPGIVWRSSARPHVSIARGSLSIICCESRNDVLAHSLNLAQEISQSELTEADPWPYNPADVVKHPGVFYINTSSTRDRIQNEIMGLWPGAQEWSVKRDRYLRDNPAGSANFFTYHVPSGEFNAHFTEISLQRTQRRATIVILNSFEFAARTARHRDDLVFQLLKLRDDGCTVIVFSQEPKRRVDKQARGPMALLRMQSDAVLDQAIFTKPQYAEPVGSTHANEEEYYAATGEDTPEYFKGVRARCAEKEEEPLPGKLTSSEIRDTVRDDIDLPQELVDGGVYSMDGKLVCANPQGGSQTMNQYAIHRNNLQSVARASVRAADSLDAANPVVYLKGS